MLIHWMTHFDKRCLFQSDGENWFYIVFSNFLQFGFYIFSPTLGIRDSTLFPSWLLYCIYHTSSAFSNFCEGSVTDSAPWRDFSRFAGSCLLVPNLSREQLPARWADRLNIICHYLVSTFPSSSSHRTFKLTMALSCIKFLASGVLILLLTLFAASAAASESNDLSKICLVGRQCKFIPVTWFARGEQMRPRDLLFLPLSQAARCSQDLWALERSWLGTEALWALLLSESFRAEDRHRRLSCESYLHLQEAKKSRSW